MFAIGATLVHMRIRASLTIVIAIGLSAAAIPAHAARTVTITGGGWGHGIGMSQYGAYGRARNGATAKEILEHYYTDSVVGSKQMPRVRVGLLQDRSSIGLSSSSYLGGSGDVEWVVAGTSKVLTTGGPGANWRVEPSATGGLRLYKNDRQVRKDGQGVFGDASTPLVLLFEKHGSLIDVVDKTYNYALGRLAVGTYSTDRCDPGFCARLVLAIKMQKYLYGLGEVPASWPPAVLQAQAIAARTYAYEKWTRSGSHRYPCDCTVYDSTIDQAYSGDGKRTGSGEFWDEWKAGVDDTKAQVIAYQGNPIQALYSSSSGGHTEHNENVWGGTPLPYLRGVPDSPDAVDANPNHRWEPVTMPYWKFENRLQSIYSIGNLMRFKVLGPRGVSDRVTVVKSETEGGVKIVGSEKTVHVSGWSFRSSFGSSILKDTLFFIDIQHEVGESFLAAYRHLDKAPGDAVGDPYPVPRGAKKPLGKAQNFEKGRMTWRAGTDKVVWQWGHVLEKYDRIGRERSAVGMPISGIWGEPTRFWGGSYVNGIVLWSMGTGAHHIRGGFHDAFVRAKGRTNMGLPISDVKKGADDALRQRFTRGTLYRPPNRAVFALWGRIDERYRAMGAGDSRCGRPTSSQVADGAGAAAAFQNGSIVWSRKGGVTVNCR